MQADNDEKRQICAMVAQKNMNDETLYMIICYCADKGWVEGLRLCVNVPRSSVERFDILIVQYCDCVLFE